MRNLVVHEVTSKSLNASSEENLVVCCGHNERSSTGELYICGHNLAVTNFDESGVKNWTADLSDLASPGNEPVNITFLTLPNALCVGLANGELLTISGSGDNSTLAGVCDNGLLALEWSPDQELVVLVTKDLNTILMSCMFDPIHEVNLLSQEFGDKQFITVGWGKKETQFHGSEGKQARAKSEVSADPNTAVEDVKITWRGDGQLYAVGFTMEGVRRFKVFDREGQLQYTSEKQQGLESNLSWRPSGNVIATTQRLADQYEVAFFEKNGLKHGGFTIPVKETTHVEDMAWSSDSEIIAIQCHDKGDNAQTVMLFTSGNYHWYLKQILCFTPDQKISKLLWDNDFDVANNKKLHVLLKSGEFYSYTWVWDIDHSKGMNNDDDAIVAVIDDKKILLTGFRQAVVPPPMCSLEIELDSFVNSIHFAPKDTGQDPNMFFVTTSDNRILFYEQTNKCPLQYKLAKSVSLVNYEFPFQYYNWHWLNNDIIVCVEVKNEAYNLLEYKLGSDALTLSNSQTLPTSVTKCNQHPEECQALYLLLSNGEIVEYHAGGNIVPQDTSFPTSCPKFCALSINNEIHFLGLSHKGNLYLDDGLIMNNVSSFFVHTHFLLLTTLKHYLLCAELTQNGLDAIKDYQKNESPYVYKRNVERGSKLVIAVPNDIRTVFQMPRGNLEAIQPRPLSLKIIGEHLDLLKYHDAFDLMRKQRINLNLFYDHDPKKFLQNIEVFLDQINNNSWLSLFISDLENVDVTHTMYSSSYADKATSTGLNASAAKIESICVKLREALENREDRDRKILPLLTTLVKMNTIPDLEGALTIVKKLKEQETGAYARLPVGSDEALKYLLYMVEVNKLFDVSLGMYDFDLVLLVANKSQKDPKEFIPMLNELNEMEEQYKRFSINKHLKRFDRAVQCLAKCGPEKREELKSFVKYHSLYQIALPLFEPDEEIYKQMSDDFGLHLKLKKLFTEAGIVYRRAKNYEKAIECFKEALEWELAVDVAQRSKMPEKEFVELCRGLISDLRQANRHKEAILLLEQYSSIHDHQEIVDIAVESGNYKTALMLCTKYNLENCIETKLKPAVLNECTNLQQSIANHLETFTRHTQRLSVVRTIKSNRPAETYDPSYANKDSDLYSDAGSTVASSTSRSSSKSFRSSKNRRKHERKVCSLKEGSQYEEVGLLMALYNQVTSAQELRGRVQEVCLALSYFGEDEEAALLLVQDNLEKLLTLMKESQKLIWTSEILLEATNADIAARDVPEGFRDVPQGMALLDVHMRIPPPIRDIKWKLEGLD